MKIIHRYKRFIPVFLIFILLLTGCASLGLNEDVGTKESRAVALHKNLAIKIADTRANIDSFCPTSTNPLSPANYSLMSEGTCREVHRIFNYASDAYVIGGNYNKILVDPDNKTVYMQDISSRVLKLLEKSEHDQDMRHLITAINNIIKTGESEDPAYKAEQILDIALLQLMPAIANILQPYIVED